MNDIEKTNIERDNSRKRTRRRNRFISLYALVVVVLVAIAGAFASLTFLFKVDEIIISGASDHYTYMEVVDASAIRAGDNLIRMDTDDNEESILSSLLYVEEATVDRVFPSTIRINVTQCIPAFNIEYLTEDGGGVLLVSRKGKVLGVNDYYTDELPTIYGFRVDPETIAEGKVVRSASAEVQNAYDQLVKRLGAWDGKEIDSIDFTDAYEINVYYRNGVIFRMGDYTDLDYKLDLAESVMKDDNVKGKKGYLTMIGSNQCSFRSGSGPMDTPAAIDPETKPAEESAATTASGAETAPAQTVTTAAPVVTQPDNSVQGWQDNWQTTPQDNGWNGQDSAVDWNNDWNSGWDSSSGNTGQSAGAGTWEESGYADPQDWLDNRPAVGIEPDEGYFDENGTFHYWWP